MSGEQDIDVFATNLHRVFLATPVTNTDAETVPSKTESDNGNLSAKQNTNNLVSMTNIAPQKKRKKRSAISRYSKGRKKKGKMQGTVMYKPKTKLLRIKDDGKKSKTKNISLPNLAISMMTNQQHVRITIATVYDRLLNFPPPAEWGGLDGTISNIHAILPFLGTSSGSRKCTRKVLLAYLQYLVALHGWTEKSGQGGKEGSDWAWAKRNWAIQLGIRENVLDYRTQAYAYVSDAAPLIGPIPKYHDRNILVANGYTLHRCAIGWWDEVHREVVIGETCMGHEQVQLRFKRDENGRLSPNGTYASLKTRHTQKYPGQCRLGLGMAMVEILIEPMEENTDGWVVVETRRECRRCVPFDYSNKTLLGISDYAEAQSREFRRLNALKNGGAWVEKICNDGDFWEADETDCLPGVATATKNKLLMGGIRTVGDLIAITDEQIGDLSKTTTLTAYTLSKLRLTATTGVINGDPPATKRIHHHKEENPYKSWYPNNWETMLKNSSAMSHYVCITALIEHMDRETRAVYKGTMFEGEEKWFHDALSLMTAHETRQWMQERGYLDRWVLPVLDLNCGRGGNWGKRPPGNSPTFMPWDETCNWDLHQATDFHTIATRHLPNQDERKFTLATPKEAAQAYKRILNPHPASPHDGVPGGDRMSHDINQVFDKAIFVTIAAHGTNVGDNQNGHRREKKNGRGGKRKRSPDDVIFGLARKGWKHPHLADVVKEGKVKIVKLPGEDKKIKLDKTAENADTKDLCQSSKKDQHK